MNNSSNIGIITHFLVVFGIVITGLLLILVGIYARKDPSGIADWMTEAGRTILVSGIIAFAYEFLMRDNIYTVISESSTKVSNDTFNDTNSLIKKINNDLNAVYDIGSSFKKHLEETQDTMKLSKDVRDCGLVKVYPKRELALKSFRDKVEQIKEQKEVNIYICGITLRDFFRKKDGICYLSFNRWLSDIENLKAHVIILDKESKAAKERAIREDPNKYISDNNALSRELEDTEESIKSSLESHSKKIIVKKSNISPLCFLAVVNDTIIMEPYNYAIAGGKVPVFEIERSNNDALFNIYMKHFISLWIKPCNGNERIGELSKYMQNIDSNSKSYADLPWNESVQIEFCKEEQM
jgi:hypothetical protein